MNNPVGETTGAAIKNSPEGMSYFIQSVSPDWIKETRLCQLCASVVHVSIFRAFILSCFRDNVLCSYL